MGLFEMFRPKSPEKPQVVQTPESKEIPAEKILSPEEKEKMRIVKEFLNLAKNIDEIAKRDPDAGFKRIDHLADEAENLKRLYKLDIDFSKRQAIADELLEVATNTPETEKYIITNNGKTRSSSLEIILRRAFGAQ